MSSNLLFYYVFSLPLINTYSTILVYLLVSEFTLIKRFLSIYQLIL